ncbi:MAG: response regulator [Anaerorhabdus sp.]
MNTNCCKIMIVDDEYIIRHGIVHFLDWEKHGFKIIGEASNGIEALEIIKKDKPHIVICDIVMPEMDGIELSKKIKELYPDIKVIVLSSYGDFDKVKQMFLSGVADYILKPTLNQKNLIESLNNVRRSIDKVKFSKSSTPTLSLQLTQLLLGLECDDIVDNEITKSNNFTLLLISGDKNSNLNDLNNFYNEQLHLVIDKSRYCILEPDDNNHVILFADSLSEEVLLKLESISKGLLVSYSLSCSDKFSDLKEINLIYEKLIKSMDSKFYLKKGEIISKNNLVNITPLKKFDMHIYNDLLYRLQLIDALEMLKKFVVESLEVKSSPKELKALIGNSFYTFISMMEEHNIDSKYIDDFKLTSLSALGSSSDECELKNELDKIIENLTIVVENYHIDKNEDTMNQIVKYLHLNYNKPLTLNKIASEFNFSYSYLSAYFNERSDLSFNEYLNKIRINKAAELLRSNKSSISEVGYDVGFSDHSYFCKVFKKQIGITPSVYRRGGRVNVE